MPRKYTIEEARAAFAAVGNTLLEEEYINAHTPMRYICKCGRTQPEIKGKRFLDVRERPHCSICGLQKRRKDFKEILQIFTQQGYELLAKEEEYINNKSPLLVKCPYGHIIHTRYNSCTSSKGCKICKYNKLSESCRHSQEFVEIFFKKNNCILQSIYLNNRTKLSFICKCGREGKRSFNKFQHHPYCKTCGIINSAKMRHKKSKLLKQCLIATNGQFLQDIFEEAKSDKTPTIHR